MLVRARACQHGGMGRPGDGGPDAEHAAFGHGGRFGQKLAEGGNLQAHLIGVSQVTPVQPIDREDEQAVLGRSLNRKSDAKGRHGSRRQQSNLLQNIPLYEAIAST